MKARIFLKSYSQILVLIQRKEQFNNLGNLYIFLFDLAEGYFQYQQNDNDTEHYWLVCDVNGQCDDNHIIMLQINTITSYRRSQYSLSVVSQLILRDMLLNYQ